MAKDKKKKNKGKKSGKGGQTAKRLRSIVTENPAVANIIASALVATAAAIKDPAKARKLAAQAGDQLTDLAKGSADRGNAMWQLALDVGRRALEEFGVTETPKAAARAAPKATRKAAPKRAAKAAPKRAAKAAPKRAVRAAPKRVVKAKAAPKRVAKAAPKRAVKAVPKRAVKAAPKRAIKTPAKSAPKVVRKNAVTRSTRPKK